MDNGRASWILGKSNDTNVEASSQPLPVNQWVHLAGTYDGIELRLYINGFLQATTPWLFGIENSTNPLTLGRLYGGTGGWQENYFTGELDEVRIWNIVRKQEDDKGDRVASGVYFYTLQVERQRNPDKDGAGEFRSIRKMVIVK